MVDHLKLTFSHKNDGGCGEERINDLKITWYIYLLLIKNIFNYSLHANVICLKASSGSKEKFKKNNAKKINVPEDLRYKILKIIKIKNYKNSSENKNMDLELY